MSKIGTLIIVACHGVYLGGATKGVDESEWLIEPFQTGEAPTYIEHVRRGVEELARSNGTALLTFSGGATKRLKTNGSVTKTEGDGYMDIALQHELFGLDTTSAARPEKLQHFMFAERYAADSYQNILLPLIQFPVRRRHFDLTVRAADPTSIKRPQIAINDMRLPQRLVIISHEFKRARFMDLHVPAIRSVWPAKASLEEMQVEFIGINPPFSEQELNQVEKGESKRGYGLWKDDLFGTGELLSEKRRERSWDEEEFLMTLREDFDEDSMGAVTNLVRGIKS